MLIKGNKAKATQTTAMSNYNTEDGRKCSKLAGPSNFQEWKSDMTFHLLYHNLWEIVSGDDPLPKDPAEIQKWKQMDNKARGIIGMHVT